MDGSKRLIGFGVGIAIALLAVTFFMANHFVATTSADGSGPEMAMTVSEGGTCDGSDCTVPSGGDFGLAVEIITAPAEYDLAQSYVIYGENLTYNAPAAAGDVFVWPDCNTSVAVTGSTSPNSVLHGCLTGLLPPLPASTYTGTLLVLPMTCNTDGLQEVQLIPAGVEPGGSSGAAFKRSSDDIIPAKVSNLNVTCGEAGPSDTATPAGPTNTPAPPTDTPTMGPPTDTPTMAPPTNTPTTPPTVCGDVNDDGDVTSLDALWILWNTAALIDDLPNTGDINGDGTVDSRDATLVLQYVADLLDSLDNCA